MTQDAWLRRGGFQPRDKVGGEWVGSLGLSLSEGESCITDFIGFLSEFY